MRTVLMKLVLLFNQLEFIAFRAVNESDFTAGTGDRRPVAQRVTLLRRRLCEGIEVVHLEPEMGQVGLHHHRPALGIVANLDHLLAPRRLEKDERRAARRGMARDLLQAEDIAIKGGGFFEIVHPVTGMKQPCNHGRTFLASGRAVKSRILRVLLISLILSKIPSCARNPSTFSPSSSTPPRPPARRPAASASGSTTWRPTPTRSRPTPTATPWPSSTPAARPRSWSRATSMKSPSRSNTSTTTASSTSAASAATIPASRAASASTSTDATARCSASSARSPFTCRTGARKRK